MPEQTCAGCGGGCSGCGGCGALSLTEAEIALLGRFAQIPFWPLGRRADGETPVCHEPGIDPGLLSSLALKGLVRLDYDLPLSNFDYRAYPECAHRGSCALTAAGIRAIELLELRGAEE